MLRGFLPPVSNRASFIDDIELIDPDDGTIWDLTGVTAQIQLERVGDCYPVPDYLPYFSYGSYPGPKLLATTENGGIVLDGTQSFIFTFTESQMASLPSGQYQLSMTAARDGETIHLFQFDIPVLAGGVPQ